MNEKMTMTLTQVAVYIGWTRRTLYNHLEAGTFPVEPIKHSHPRRWNKEDIDAWRFSTGEAQQA